ncbi:MAG: T9SS type A sorting domain-containing protein [Bacteroidia bacterium]
MSTKLMKSRILITGLIFLSFAFKSFGQSANIVGPTLNCQGTPLTLTVNINGLTAPYAYLWTNGATTSTVTISNNSLLRVAVVGTNASGNLQTVQSPFRFFLFLPAPNATITPSGPTTFCTGGSVNLVATGGNFFSTFLWSTGQVTQAIHVTTAGTYTVTITSGITGCAGISAPVTVTVANIVASIAASGPTTLCPGQTVDLTANGGTSSSTYLWSSGETTQTITAGSSGNYDVTISDPSGCSGTATQTVEVLDPAYEPKFTADGPIVFCKPGSVTLTADPGFSDYLWSNGATTSSVTITLDGSQAGAVLDTMSVSLTVTLNGLCSFTSGSIVIRSIREPNLISAFCPNFNMDLSADSIKSGLILSYNGSDPDYEFEFTETTNPTNIFTASALQTRWLKLSDVTPSLVVGKFYNVRVRGIVDGIGYCYGNFCQIGVATARVAGGNGATRVVYDEDGEAITVRDGLNFNIYPNPSNSSFTANIFTLDENPVVVKIFDLSGREVSSSQFDASQSQYEFGSELNAGIYFVQFTQGNNLTQTTKLIKTN